MRQRDPVDAVVLSPLLNPVEHAYRQHSRRVLATLIRLLGDFALAEEAMQEAYAAALQQWPEQGVPDNPSAWLIGVGQRRGIDQIRRRQRDAGTASLLHVAGFPVRAGLEKHLQQERLPDQVNVHMAFPGTCREAMQFYAEATGGHLEAMITFGETPFGETPAAKDVPPEWHDKIIHASLNLSGRRLMAADMAPECFSPPQGAEIHLEYHDATQAEAVFRQLSGGGMVLMPFEQTFFARRFGMTTDRYGIGWMVSSGIDQCGDNIEGVRS